MPLFRATFIAAFVLAGSFGLAATAVGQDPAPADEAAGESPPANDANPESEGDDPTSAETSPSETGPSETSEAPTPSLPANSLDHAARITFEAGREAFARGDYEVAFSRFRQAYELSGRPALLYNIAVALDRLRRDAEALAKFREYLEAVPSAPNRAEVEARTRVLERAVAERQAAEPAPELVPAEVADPEPVAPPPPPESEGLHPALAISVGGAAVVTLGLVLWSGLDAQSLDDDYVEYATGAGATFDEAKARLDDVQAAETRTNVLIGLAAGLGATAVVLAIFTDWDGEEEPTLPSVALGPDGFSLGARGRF